MEIGKKQMIIFGCGQIRLGERLLHFLGMTVWHVFAIML